MNPLILTYTGKHVNPLDLRPEDIDIRDIAHALACCNRFAGHCQRPITVAQHSVYVSRLVQKPTIQWHGMQGLLHDASEAYLGDVTKWLKNTEAFAGYREAEERIQGQILHHFGCPKEMIEDVAHADKLMLTFEGEMGFGYKAWKKWSELIAYPMVTQEGVALIGAWKPWSWRASEEGFLTQYRLLGGVI